MQVDLSRIEWVRPVTTERESMNSFKAIIATALLAVSVGSSAQGAGDTEGNSAIAFMGIHLNMRMQELPESIRHKCFVGGSGNIRFCVNTVTLDGISLAITLVLEWQRVKTIWVFYDSSSFDTLLGAFRAKYGKEFSYRNGEVTWKNANESFSDDIVMSPTTDYGHDMLSKDGRQFLHASQIGAAVFQSRVARRAAEAEKQNKSKSLADKF